MYTCPACGNDDVAGRSTCQCGANLTILLRLEGAADTWFNNGLAALAAGNPGKAVEWFSACCAARPGDGEARLALAQSWCQLGRWAEARAAVLLCRQVDPDLSQLNELEEALAEL